MKREVTKIGGPPNAEPPYLKNRLPFDAMVAGSLIVCFHQIPISKRYVDKILLLYPLALFSGKGRGGRE